MNKFESSYVNQHNCGLKRKRTSNSKNTGGCNSPEFLYFRLC